MKKHFFLLLFTFYLSFIIGRLSLINASYVLPYPSAMPGNKLYTLERFFDTVKKYWCFGSIASYKYELGLADKYLVEAKTLFEYKQFLLAADALKRSDIHVEKLPSLVFSIEKEGKDTHMIQQNISQAMEEHIRVLYRIKEEVPESFEWNPEKGNKEDLQLHTMIQNAMLLRRNIQAGNAYE